MVTDSIRHSSMQCSPSKQSRDFWHSTFFQGAQRREKVERGQNSTNTYSIKMNFLVRPTGFSSWTLSGSSSNTQTASRTSETSRSLKERIMEQEEWYKQSCRKSMKSNITFHLYFFVGIEVIKSNQTGGNFIFVRKKNEGSILDFLSQKFVSRGH